MCSPQLMQHRVFTTENLNSLSILMPSRLALVAIVAHHAASYAVKLGLKRFDQVELALIEGLNNAVIHAHGQCEELLVKVLVKRVDNEVIIQIKDRTGTMSKSVLQAAINSASKSENLLKTQGRGLALINAVMDRMVYSDNSLWMSKTIL